MKITFVAVFIAGFIQTIALADGNTGIVRGVALQADSNQPLSGKHVIWVNASGMGATQTDGHGRFYLFNVTPGVTRVYVTVSGFHVVCAKGSVHANEIIDVTIPVTYSRSLVGCGKLHATGRDAVEDRL
ncbi:MAG TPA: hypothetical protein VGR69_04285 [Candidatus Rubrimentiphilum sp.]|nr:hypothetical protein [Candidatus Rubrimentiphilum sp.]